MLLKPCSMDTRHDRPLTADIMRIFRAGNVVNISQLTAQLIQEPRWRTLGTQEVRAIVFSLEKEAILVRENCDGITRFRWSPMSTTP